MEVKKIDLISIHHLSIPYLNVEMAKVGKNLSQE